MEAPSGGFPVPGGACCCSGRRSRWLRGRSSTVKDWPGFEPSVFALNVVGTLGWVVAVGALAVAARRMGAPRSQWILIALAALFLMGGHPEPAGTLAFGSLFLAALLRERSAAAAGRVEASDAYSGAREP